MLKPHALARRQASVAASANTKSVIVKPPSYSKSRTPQPTLGLDEASQVKNYDPSLTHCCLQLCDKPRLVLTKSENSGNTQQ